MINKLDEIFKLVSNGVVNYKSCEECIHSDVCFIRCTYEDNVMKVTALLRRHHGATRMRLDELGHKKFVQGMLAGLCMNYVPDKETAVGIPQ